MNAGINNKHWNEIFDFILEISKGKFTLQLAIENNFNLFETLVMMLNNMNQEINTILHHIKPNESYPVPKHYLIIFNANFRTQHISPPLLKTLDLKPEAENKKLSDLLTSESLKTISYNIKLLKGKKENEIAFPISFITNKGHLLSADAIITQDRNITPGLFFLSAVKIIYKNEQLENLIKNRSKGKIPSTPTKYRSLLLQENRDLAEKIYNIIIQNLDGKMPKLNSISEELGASPSKLHKAFKFYYGKSISQIHNIKRLEQAHRLLSNTEMSVIKVAIECGYKGAAHFSRKFKKHYGYSPSHIKLKPKNMNLYMK